VLDACTLEPDEYLGYVCARLRAGALPTGRDYRLRTPLLTSAIGGAAPYVGALLAAGARVDDVDVSGDSALHLATAAAAGVDMEVAPEELGHVSACVQLLLSARCCLSAQNRQGDTPLHFCVKLQPAVGQPLLRLMLSAPEADTVSAALTRNRHGVTPRGSCQDGRGEMAAMLDSFTHAREAALRWSLLRDDESANEREARAQVKRKGKKKSR